MGARRTAKDSKVWLVERREILEKIKDQVRLYLGQESRELSLYAKAYKRDLQRAWRASDLHELHTCLLQVDVVFGGDFHPFSQAQRAHLRLMRRLVGDRPLVLAFECLLSGHNKKVARFLSSQMPESEFLQAVRWEKRWGFPWSHYRPLFEFARSHSVPVYGLNTASKQVREDLHRRDKFAAEQIELIKKRHPEALVYVLYGDLHVAEHHLPRALKNLRKRHQPALDTATVYLNSEQIYFALAEQGSEGRVEVVAFNDRQYCLLSSPPWVKWQSYLMYLEENFDVDLDLDEDDDEDSDWDFRIDHTDHVSNLVAMIASSIEIDIKRDAIEVYSLQDPQILKKILRYLDKPKAQIARSLVKSDRGFYVPEGGFFYLSKATVNHAASLAGHYVHAQLCQRGSVCWSFPDDFMRVIWLEAMAFLLSKFVNPKRKAQTMADLKKELQAFDKEDKGREPLLLALDQKMSELLNLYTDRSKASLFEPRDKSSYVHAAQFLGEMLGERYFVLFQSQRIGITEIRALLMKPVEIKEFADFYYLQLKELDRIEMAEGLFQ